MNWDGTISLLIACIEFILLINLLALAEKSKPNKLAMGMIALLFVYQLFEFLICNTGLTNSFFAYIAFADISFLPPLSLYFVLSFLGYHNKKYTLIFLPAAILIIYYAFVIESFEVVKCTVIYASYNYPLGTLYGAFYYLPIIISMMLLSLQVKKEKEGKKSLLAKVILSGFVLISLPVIAAFILKAFNFTFLLSIIESIMCKFAVILAMCLGFFCLYGKPPRKILSK